MFRGDVENVSLAHHIYIERKQYRIAFQGYVNESRKFKILDCDLFSILNEFSVFNNFLRKKRDANV